MWVTCQVTSSWQWHHRPSVTPVVYNLWGKEHRTMKTQTLCVLYLFISLSSSQRIQDIEPVPVILTGDSQCEHCPNKVSYNCKISNKIIWGVQLARKSTAKNTKPVFGQHTKTSINLDSLGYLITLFIVGKNLTSSQNNLFYRYLHRFISHTTDF